MDPVHQQYEAYPYPARDPADEARRLIEGSPSHPVEIDHFLFGGKRDWAKPFRALVAGGGTGDGLIMLAQKLRDLSCPAEITYIDLSRASRQIAEARAKARALNDIRFVTGDLCTAPELGPFDYIDCCGVLHHLPDPDQGIAALAAALAPGGGMGIMVYAPYGRSGVYPLQAAFAQLCTDTTPQARLAMARQIVAQLPAGHPFCNNRIVQDHLSGDAGFYDLLLHSRDRPYTVAQLVQALGRVGLDAVSFLEPARYDPLRYLPRTDVLAKRVQSMEPLARASLAEELTGTIKTHIVYAARQKDGSSPATPARPQAVPHIRGVNPQALARQIAQGRAVQITLDGHAHRLHLPKSAAPLIGAVGNQRSLGEIASATGLDWLRFSGEWGPVDRGLRDFNLLHYSQFARR